MKLELNNSGAWKTVLTGLQPGQALERAKEAAVCLSACDSAAGHARRASLRWRLVSEGDDGKVVQYGDAEGWTPLVQRTVIPAQ